MISEVIKKIRSENKLTQKELADILFVSDKTISSWENNRTVPDIFMLERISKIYQIPMNDLMKGNVSFLSKLRYKITKHLKQLSHFIKQHLFVSFVSIGAIVSTLILFLLSPLPAYIYMNVWIIVSMIILIVRFSKWYIALFFMPLQLLISDLVLLINPTYFGEVFDGSQVVLMDQFFSIGFLSVLILSAIYNIYLFIKKTSNRFYHVFINLVYAIWLVVVFLYEKSIKLYLNYSSFTDQWTYRIEKNDSFWYTTIAYLFIISIVLTLHHKIKKLSKA